MSRRAVVLILAGVIAAAVAIPALANPSTTAVSASVKSLSKRALAKAKDSLRLARSAKRSARQAQNLANGAEASASAAQGSASAAQTAATAAQGSAANALKAATSASEKAGGAELNAKEAKAEVASTRAKIGLAEDPATTESESFVKLGGGPSVTVNVPPTGLIQVWAQRRISAARIAIVFSLETVFAGLFGYWLADDRLGWLGWGGCAVILAGIVLAEPTAARFLRSLLPSD